MFTQDDGGSSWRLLACGTRGCRQIGERTTACEDIPHCSSWLVIEGAVRPTDGRGTAGLWLAPMQDVTVRNCDPPGRHVAEVGHGRQGVTHAPIVTGTDPCGFDTCIRVRHENSGHMMDMHHPGARR
ncbi:hypothetical protein GCM10027030_26600 [Luteococcus sediminum]